jgi:hypothetical protein
VADRVFGQSLACGSSIGKNWIPRGTHVVPCTSLVFPPLAQPGMVPSP